MDCAKSYCGTLTDEMREFVHANPRDHSYHYTDVPFQLAAYEASAVGTDPDNVVQILQQAIRALQRNTDAVTNPHRFTLRQALLLLARLIGGIHQPLHVASAVSRRAAGTLDALRQQVRGGPWN